MPTQPSNRLYFVTANWQEKNKNFTRDFIICAESKSIAEKIAQNHIPHQLMHTDTQPNNLKLRVRDLGTPNNRRTYYSSDIKQTDRTSVDDPSPFEQIVTQMSMLWGNELGYRIALQNKGELNHDEELALFAIQNEPHPTKKLIEWTHEYLISTNTTVETFFHLQLKALSHTNMKASKITQTTTSEQSVETLQTARKTARQIQETAETDAKTILEKAHQDAECIINTAESKRDLILQKLTEETNTKLEQFHQYVETSKSAIDKASAMVFGIEKLYKQVTNDQYRIIEEMQHIRNPKDKRSIWDMIYAKPDDTTSEKENPYTILVSKETLKHTDVPDFHITKTDLTELLKQTIETPNTESTDHTSNTEESETTTSEPKPAENTENEIKPDETMNDEISDTTPTETEEPAENHTPELPEKLPELTLDDISIESMITVLKMYSIPTQNGTKVNGYTWLTTVAKNANRLDILKNKVDIMKTLQRTAPVDNKNGWIYLLTHEYNIDPSKFQLTKEEQAISDANDTDIPKLEQISDQSDEETVIT